jgi:ATP-dependent Clp protease ATP-binding subunit ClpA
MLELLDQEARLVLVTAQRGAFHMSHLEVTPLHLLFALLDDRASQGSASILQSAGIQPDEVMRELRAIQSLGRPIDQVTYSAEASAAIRAACQKPLRNEMVGALDLLVALLDHHDDAFGRLIAANRDRLEQVARDRSATPPASRPAPRAEEGVGRTVSIQISTDTPGDDEENLRPRSP